MTSNRYNLPFIFTVVSVIVDDPGGDVAVTETSTVTERPSIRSYDYALASREFLNSF